MHSIIWVASYLSKRGQIERRWISKKKFIFNNIARLIITETEVAYHARRAFGWHDAKLLIDKDFKES